MAWKLSLKSDLKYHILMVLDHYPPILGGAQIQTQLLSRKLVQRGHQVSVITTWQAGLPEQEDDNGVRVFRIKGLLLRVPLFYQEPRWRRYPPPFPDPGLVFNIRRLIARLKPDVVQIYGWISYSCAAALLVNKVPLILSARDYGHSCATRLFTYRDQICAGPRLVKCVGCASQYFGMPKAIAAIAGIRVGRRLLIRKTRAFHSVSKFVQFILLRDFLQNSNLIDGQSSKPIPTMVIHDIAYESETMVSQKDYLNELPTQPFILFVGTLTAHKGLPVLLQAFEQLASPPPLVLIGISPPGSHNNFPKGVTVIRDAPHPSVLDAMGRCLFGVVPSTCPDALPNAVLEFMSKGKAVIGTAVGGIPDMILHNETGLLVPLWEVSALADAMSLLIEDVELRERLGFIAKQRVKLFSSDAIVPRFEALYKKLVSPALENRK